LLGLAVCARQNELKVPSETIEDISAVGYNVSMPLANHGNLKRHSRNWRFWAGLAKTTANMERRVIRAKARANMLR
jgi:hypothetical protein